MPNRNTARAFLALWWTLGILLVAYSVQTSWLSLAASSGIDVHVAILASTEAIAGLLFLIPKTMRAGGVCLLAVFTLALVLHGRKGEFEGQLLESLFAAHRYRVGRRRDVGEVVVRGVVGALHDSFGFQYHVL
jgi:hypothetical protein